MDFLNRSNNQPQPVRAATPGAAPAAPAHQPGAAKSRTGMSWVQPGWLRVVFIVLLFSVTGLAIAVALLVHKSGGASEISYVNTSKYQAVFLTSGQVYFGKIQHITKSYVDLTDIFYLNSQQAAAKDATTTPTKFQLVKLGCEMHGPADQMLINRDQVTFWENLKDDRQVVQTIGQWKQQYPDGQKCPDTANSTQQSSSDSASNTQSTSDSTTNKKP